MDLLIQTEPAYIERIDMGEKGFSLGSCFAENIAAKLAHAGFGMISNPFGVLYNPASIAGAIEILAAQRKFTLDDLVSSGGVWCSPLFHGSFSGPDPEAVADRMNRAVDTGREALAGADFVLVSFGTPWVYTVSREFQQSALPAGAVAANCHKFPARYYDRQRMETDEISQLFARLSDGPLKGKKIIYTVSPVRYVKDGLHGSNLGKAVLHLAVERICKENKNSYYFPAYEILTDELRDYRFYGDDMVHPSPAAVEYIWEVFRRTAIAPEAAEAAREIEKFSGAMHHRVQAPGSAEHVGHLRSMLAKTNALENKYPLTDLSVQTAYFTSELEKYE